jgi:hypothetical protein
MRHVTFLPQLGSLSPLTAGNRNFCGGPVGSKVKFPVRALAGRLHELQPADIGRERGIVIEAKRFRQPDTPE